MNLAIDIGNTRSKAALFEGKEMVKRWESEGFDVDGFGHYLGNTKVDNTLVAASGHVPKAFTAFMDAHLDWKMLDHEMKFPFTIGYRTPETLGRDRIACVAGALVSGVKPPALIISAGTCITMDVIDNTKIWVGGSISPGLNMRAVAMHEKTAGLPLVSFNEEPNLIGKTTVEALQTGAFMGALCEMEGYYIRCTRRYGKINPIITGGNADFFARKFKYRIFAVPDLVLIGLNHIIQLNAT